jgi:hypothetical protein
MESSRDEAHSVDPTPTDEPEAHPPAPTRPDRRPRPRPAANGLPESLPRYSPVVLVLDVVHLLGGQGVAVSEAHENLHEAIEASSDLLRWLGIEADKRLLIKPREAAPELVAAAVLMRAAGIEPNAIKIWPGRTS